MTRQAGRKARHEDAATKAYREMLNEAVTSEDRSVEPARPLKKPRTRRAQDVTSHDPQKSHDAVPSDIGSRDCFQIQRSPQASPQARPPQSLEQTVPQDSDSSEEDSDVDWQNLLPSDNAIDEADDQQEQPDVLSIDFNKNKETPSIRRSARRLPASASEKQKRLDIHKIHICCQLVHFYICNWWCDDDGIKSVLRPLLSDKIIGLLNPSSTNTQPQRTRSILMGLEQASDFWRGHFRIQKGGWRTPSWSLENDPIKSSASNEKTESKADLYHAAKKREGSRDIGAQLFCALLRSVGVRTRLICSLQPLSFSKVLPAPIATPSKPTYYLSESAAQSGNESAAEQTDASVASVKSHTSSIASLKTPKPVRRFGSRRDGGSPVIDQGVAPSSVLNPSPKQAPRATSAFPVFWVEVFNTALQKWIAVDPLATRTVNRPQKLEPPASDSLNSMTYVIAFDGDRTAKDVTRRYAKAYNAKTRRARVESTRDGAKWFKSAMKIYRRRQRSDQDQVEEAELAQKEAQEPLPRNVQDFKDHPLYALERHLRRNEVIHPRQEVGKLKVGKNADIVEPIFRRRNIHAVKSGDKWYRQRGREIIEGETPLKYSVSRNLAVRKNAGDGDESDLDDDYVPLYAGHQTELYKPPPVVGGRVPRNFFGNLDVYVSTMIPPGAAHVRSSDAVAAARIVAVDFAEAVTGFSFRGRGQRGTAVINGVIVAKEYVEAIEAVIEGLRNDRDEVDRAKRSRVALAAWKKFLLGLRIRERVMKDAETEAGDTIEEENPHDDHDTNDESQSGSEYMEDEGGFLLEQNDDISVQDSGITKRAEAQRGQDLEVSEAVRHVNEDATASFDVSIIGKHRHWNEPTVYSPWDIIDRPHSREQVADDAQKGLFDPDDEVLEGGFLHEEGSPLPPKVEPASRASIANVVEIAYGQNKAKASVTKSPRSQQSTQSGDVVDEFESNTKTESPFSNVGAEISSFANDLTQAKSSTAPASMDGADSKQKAESKDDPEQSHSQESVNQSPGVPSDHEDATSLLSHDPEDEEAEPEWLADEASLYSN